LNGKKVLNKMTAKKPTKKAESDTDRLVAAIGQQTEAIGALVHSVDSLVRINAQLLEALSEIDDLDDDDQPRTYMDGTPIDA